MRCEGHSKNWHQFVYPSPEGPIGPWRSLSGEAPVAEHEPAVGVAHRHAFLQDVEDGAQAPSFGGKVRDHRRLLADDGLTRLDEGALKRFEPARPMRKCRTRSR